MTDSPNDARKFSFKLLGYRARSEAELKERLLSKGFSEETVSRTLKDLKEAGYLNDRELAESLKRQLIEDRMLGFEAVKRFMLKRGLSKDVIDSVMMYEEHTELRNVRRLVDKRKGSVGNYLSLGEKRKLWNFLARRGYSSAIITKVLKSSGMKEEDEW